MTPLARDRRSSSAEPRWSLASHVPWHDLAVPKSQTQPCEASSFKHEVHTAGLRALLRGWQPSSAHKWPPLCARLGTCIPMQPSMGASPRPHSTGSCPAEAPEAFEVCRFQLGQRAWGETAMHKHDKHNPRQTQRGPHAALPPPKKGRGMVELRLSRSLNHPTSGPAF